MKDAKGHGSNPRGAHAAGTDQVGRQPLTMYHGSANNFSEFQLGHGSPGSQNGVWLAEDPTQAKEYAQISARAGGEPMLYHAKVSGNMASQAQWEHLENTTPGSHYSFERDKAFVAKLQSQGYDGVKFGRAVFMFNPKNITIVKKQKLKKTEED